MSVPEDRLGREHHPGREERLLGGIHARAHPVLDALAGLSHQLGRVSFCAALVAAGGTWHLHRKRRREAALWFGLGLSSFLLQAGIKPVVRRQRPRLWSGPVTETGYSFPSGHALVASTLYPLLGRELGRRGSWVARLAGGLGGGVAAFVGLGRLYLGLHWPSDVLAGWVLGAGQTALGVALVEKGTKVR